MSMVRFAMVCDKCGKRGEEYSSDFTGHDPDCGDDVCRECAVVWEDGDESSNRAWCKACVKRAFQELWT